MSDLRFAALCLVTVSILTASVVLHCTKGDGSGWGIMAFIFTILVILHV